MKFFIKNFNHMWLWFVSLFFEQKRIESYDQGIKPTNIKKGRRLSSDSDEYEYIGTQYRTIKCLLKDLDRLFGDMNALRPKKKFAQKLISKYGPYVANLEDYEDDENVRYYGGKLESFKAYGAPAMLILYINNSERNKKNKTGKALKKQLEEDETFTESFSVALKMSKIDYLLPSPGCCLYEFTSTFVHKDKKDPCEIYSYIEVNEKTGEVRAIPTLTTESCSMKRKRNDEYSRIITHQRYEYPPVDVRTVHASQEFRRQRIEMQFCLVYNITMKREHGVNIIVKKGKHRATFCVPQRRWKYFFRDRIDVKTASGKLRPIFHPVMSHYRQTKKGEVPVKTHYKGSRHFVWSGYEVKIIMPEKHGLPQAAFGIAASTGLPKRKTLDPAGKRMSGSLNKLFEGEKVDLKQLASK